MYGSECERRRVARERGGERGERERGEREGSERGREEEREGKLNQDRTMG